MNATTGLNDIDSQLAITSPSGTNLTLAMFKSKEGITQQDVDTYEGVMTFKELADSFGIEPNSDLIDEKYKRQRDVDTRRINGFKSYWESSKATVFPNITIFVNEIEVIKEVDLVGKTLVSASLKPESSRLISDGQGRTTFIKWLLAQDQMTEFESHTIAYKLIVTNTPTLNCQKSNKLIKQLFSDYHSNIVKPSQSISKYFDSSTPFSRLMNALLEIQLDDSHLLKDVISLNGKIKRGQVWNFVQLNSLVQKFLKVTPVTANKQLADEQIYTCTLELCTNFLKQIFSQIPFGELDTDNYLAVHEKVMYTKAVFANALGFIGRSLLDEMLIDYKRTWDELSLELILKDKLDKFWTTSKVTHNDEGKITILKGTERRIGALLCRELRIYPCTELLA
ncbi:DGQHR domain-containing protein [Pseudoalteromonas sp. SG44-1]|uniref:DGQHR domain-containing protein n=1 Tax=Pseudoalteromonas sp. SG44-1 TaxID=2760964 RepID=UPI001600A015|nr:DGQHR domain-containing protein [Pseudoalteromonas sp. SG44-1]MBB1419859.1 DGQHR domain-containing protein [Pseudoalteromonas sp. SG44-1]